MPEDYPAGLPRPHNVWMPLFIIFAAFLLVATIVLTANGGRNMNVLFKAFDLPVPDLLKPARPSEAPPDRHEVTTSRDWPWSRIVTPIDRLIPAPLPEALCQSLAADGQEAPSFSRSTDGGWECSTLLTASRDENASSLFLQTRGAADNRFNAVRVKFNLMDGALTTELGQSAIGFVNATMSLRPSDQLEDELMEKLIAREDFYFFAGYHALTFRREIDAADRYNLIGFDRRSTGNDLISEWPRIRKPGEWRIALVQKGPRLSSQLP